MPDIRVTYKIVYGDDKGYNIEFLNKGGKSARFSINGKPIIAPTEVEEELIRAFTNLDTAVCNMATNRMKLEEVFK